LQSYKAENQTVENSKGRFEANSRKINFETLCYIRPFDFRSIDTLSQFKIRPNFFSDPTKRASNVHLLKNFLSNFFHFFCENTWTPKTIWAFWIQKNLIFFLEHAQKIIFQAVFDGEFGRKKIMTKRTLKSKLYVVLYLSLTVI
jgi:hypothetical protein